MARSFDGSNDGLTFAGAPTTATTLTMCGWFWINSSGVQTGALVTLGTSGANGNKRDVIYNNTTTQFQARSVNNAIATNSASITSTGFFDQWVFLAGVWNGVADRTIYRGTSTANDTASNSPNAPNQVRVGLTPASSAFLKGRAAEVAMWDVVLTADELASLALGLSPLSVRPAGQVGYWPLVGRTSPEIDLVGGNGLSLVDAPAVADHPKLYQRRSRAAMIKTAVSAVPKRYLLVRN